MPNQSENPRRQPRRPPSSADITGGVYVRLGALHRRVLHTRYPSVDAPLEGQDARQTQQDEQQTRGVYIISVASRLLEMHPQTLRKYERIGLVTPFRTVGSLRLYSEEDILRLRLIKHLVGDLGLNLAGVQLVLSLFNMLLELRVGIGAVEDADLQVFLEEGLDEMLELLQARVS